MDKLWTVTFVPYTRETGWIARILHIVQSVSKYQPLLYNNGSWAEEQQLLTNSTATNKTSQRHWRQMINANVKQNGPDSVTVKSHARSTVRFKAETRDVGTVNFNTPPFFTDCCVSACNTTRRLKWLLVKLSFLSEFSQDVPFFQGLTSSWICPFSSFPLEIILMKIRMIIKTALSPEDL